MDPAVVAALVRGAFVDAVVTTPPLHSTLAGQSQQLQDGLKRRVGLQFMTFGTP